MDNLDIRCAELGERIAAASDVNTITKSLGVLEEQGLYAFFLYLKVETVKNVKVKDVSDQCFKFLVDHNLAEGLDTFAGMKKLAENLDHLLLARDLLHQSLVYARYHAKAKG